MTTLDPRRTSNVLAMAALNVPIYLAGRPYHAGDVRRHLLTALTGFVAAKAAAGDRALVLHTGNWGTGAFGNDPELMAMVQIVAARAAGVDTLVYHTVSREKLAAVERARADPRDIEAAGDASRSMMLDDYVRGIVALNRPYGRGNGT